MANDVLEVLHRAYENAGAPDEFGNAITDIAEMIAANVEGEHLNAEWLRLTLWMVSPASVPPDYSASLVAIVRDQIDKNTKRRAAALAACRGMA